MIEHAWQWVWLIESAVKKNAPPEDWVTLILTKSGICLYLIITASIVGLAIVFMKAIAIRAGRIVPHALGRDLIDLARRRDVQGIAEICQRFRHVPLARVTASGIEIASAGADVVEKEMVSTARFEMLDRTAYLPFLNVLSYVATLLGLLGTVTGMINAFRNIHAQGTTSTEFVAAGVYESLLNTAEGLFVAIIFYVAYHYFRSRATAISNQFEEYITRFINALFYGSASGGGNTQ